MTASSRAEASLGTLRKETPTTAGDPPSSCRAGLAAWNTSVYGTCGPKANTLDRDESARSSVPSFEVRRELRAQPDVPSASGFLRPRKALSGSLFMRLSVTRAAVPYSSWGRWAKRSNTTRWLFRRSVGHSHPPPAFPQLISCTRGAVALSIFLNGFTGPGDFLRGRSPGPSYCRRAKPLIDGTHGSWTTKILHGPLNGTIKNGL